MGRRKAAELEAEPLRIQQRVEKVIVCAKVLKEIQNEDTEVKLPDDRENMRMHSLGGMKINKT